MNALCGAIIGLSVFFADENQLRTFTFWTLGDLGGATWNKLIVAGPILIVAPVLLLFHTRALNALALGEAEAYHMGVDVERTKLMIILLSALGVGVSVSMSGMIGFIGLVIPHLIRILFHPDNRLVLPASILGGALLLILADIVARTVVMPSEMPIGVVTALIGAPFFMGLLLKAKKKKRTVMYTASNLSLRIDKKPILNDVSLMLEPGKFTAIVGANGAGKSTLLRMLANELRPTSGQVSINGKSIQNYAPRELSKVRAVLPQHSQVPFAFSVEQIVRLGRHAHRTTDAVNDAIVRDVMALDRGGPFSWAYIPHVVGRREAARAVCPCARAGVGRNRIPALHIAGRAYRQPGHSPAATHIQPCPPGK